MKDFKDTTSEQYIYWFKLYIYELLARLVDEERQLRKKAPTIDDSLFNQIGNINEQCRLDGGIAVLRTMLHLIENPEELFKKTKELMEDTKHER